MKIKTELLNFFTGLLVTGSGVLNLAHGHFEMGMSWIIFGAMYLVMGDYIQNEKLNTFSEKLLDWGRRIFSWVGLTGALVLCVYYIRLFYFITQT